MTITATAGAATTTISIQVGGVTFAANSGVPFPVTTLEVGFNSIIVRTQSILPFDTCIFQSEK